MAGGKDPTTSISQHDAILPVYPTLGIPPKQQGIAGEANERGKRDVAETSSTRIARAHHTGGSCRSILRGQYEHPVISLRDGPQRDLREREICPIDLLADDRRG